MAINFPESFKKEILEKTSKEFDLATKKLSQADLTAVSGGVITRDQHEIIEHYAKVFKDNGFSRDYYASFVVNRWKADDNPPTMEEMEEWLDKYWDNL